MLTLTYLLLTIKIPACDVVIFLGPLRPTEPTWLPHCETAFTIKILLTYWSKITTGGTLCHAGMSVSSFQWCRRTSAFPSTEWHTVLSLKAHCLYYRMVASHLLQYWLLTESSLLIYWSMDEVMQYKQLCQSFERGLHLLADSQQFVEMTIISLALKSVINKKELYPKGVYPLSLCSWSVTLQS